MTVTMLLKSRPVDPDNADDIAELKRQRKLCGWYEEKVSSNMAAVKRGDMYYFMFFRTSDPEATVEAKQSDIIGSGGLDLNAVLETEDMCSHSRKEFNVMGMFLYSEYRGLHLFRPMAEMLVNLGFDQLGLASATVMTNEQNPATNHVFKSLGFKEFFREEKPEWHIPAIGIHYRCTLADRNQNQKRAI